MSPSLRRYPHGRSKVENGLPGDAMKHAAIRREQCPTLRDKDVEARSFRNMRGHVLDDGRFRARVEALELRGDEIERMMIPDLRMIGLSGLSGDSPHRPEVMQCYVVKGKADFVLMISMRDVHHYEAFATRVFRQNHDIRHFETMVVMSRVKVGPTLPIETSVRPD